MRSEHPLKAFEVDAHSRFRRFLSWKPGQRKRVKAHTNRHDRRAQRQRDRRTSQTGDDS